MTATFQASGTHAARTRDGGQIVYTADGIQILDAIAAFIIFFVILCWGAVVTGGNDSRAMVLPGQVVKPESWRGSGVGRLWVGHYIKAVFGG
jgi:hypothetical protein